jgi:hypothetical protein
MNETLTKLQTFTTGSGSTGAVYFTNIPQNYTDLIIKVSARSDAAQSFQNLDMVINGGGGTYVAEKRLGASGSGSPYSDSFTNMSVVNFWESDTAASNTASVFSNVEIYIPNYSGNTFKQISTDAVAENNATDGRQRLFASIWQNTSPITSLQFNGYNFVQYSTFTLYGVKALRTAVGNSIKATGGSITFDGTYVYHTFNSTGTFTPTSKVITDVVVAAGGGGGGGSTSGSVGGGGGAGGLAYAPLVSLTPGFPYTVTVGAGGAGGTSGTNSGTTGSNSGVGLGSVNITTFGGGYGSYGNATGTSVAGGSGGSGGGAGWGTNYGSLPGGSATQTSGTGYTGYGNAGGAVTLGGGNAAGGGGAGSVGLGNSASGTGGSGLVEFGNTLATGGTGYSGAVSNGVTPNPASPNTGNGGLGGWGSAGGAGASGVVIFRYKA